MAGRVNYSYGEGEQHVRTILIAVDRSEHSERAFDWYMQTLHKEDNRIVLVHIPELPALEMARGSKLSESEIQKLVENEKAETAEMVAKYQEKLVNLRAKSEYKTVYGKPGEALVNAAAEEKATVIIMGTRGMGTVRRTILGSVSDYVVHHADMPVIVYRQ